MRHQVNSIIIILLLAVWLSQSPVQPQTASDRTRGSRQEESSSTETKKTECDFSRYKTIRSWDLINPQMLAKDMKPAYPSVALKAHIQGIVNVKALISRDGKVILACATSGHPLLRSAAVTATKQLEFRPICTKCPSKRFYEEIFTYKFAIDEFGAKISRSVR